MDKSIWQSFLRSGASCRMGLVIWRGWRCRQCEALQRPMTATAADCHLLWVPTRARLGPIQRPRHGAARASDRQDDHACARDVSGDTPSFLKKELATDDVVYLAPRSRHSRQLNRTQD